MEKMATELATTAIWAQTEPVTQNGLMAQANAHVAKAKASLISIKKRGKEIEKAPSQHVTRTSHSN